MPVRVCLYERGELYMLFCCESDCGGLIHGVVRMGEVVGVYILWKSPLFVIASISIVALSSGVDTRQSLSVKAILFRKFTKIGVY